MKHHVNHHLNHQYLGKYWATCLQKCSEHPGQEWSESTKVLLSIERQILSPSSDPLTPRGRLVKWTDYGDGKGYCKWGMGNWTKIGAQGEWELEGGGTSLLYPKEICRMEVEVGVCSAGWGESLDSIDPSKPRFSLQVKLDIEKIMEKLGGVFK